VWSNVIAGTVAATLVLDAPLRILLWPAVAASLFYTAGMFLNDAFDAPFDRHSRPERPIPRGDVAVREAAAVGGILLVAAIVMLSSNILALGLGLVLAAAIVFYDYRHKGSATAPLVMGACRGLVYLIAASWAGALSGAAFTGAVVMVLYVAALTVVAKRAGANARWLVPALIAGISLVDALFIVLVSPTAFRLALVAALGFPLTLVLQRWVPGD
jgi:4-hydroxybenzoate polyprenyltransferase